MVCNYIDMENLYQKLLKKQETNRNHYNKYKNYYKNYYHLKKKEKWNKQFILIL